ncbi:signal transduction histidine kinase [Methanohalophilus levihalophilus]|uniref:sensor histidine kinase n=1 Tax=Methanohalophilus levihalophilus TaxID=1431282 RepID=UPI001AEB2052|nr:ATP-binding protein [Methanohalophilus levihalophilus]MBP2029269.1 signal transduction histidine kinase [Methanohalophilus levihalophilus]
MIQKNIDIRDLIEDVKELTDPDIVMGKKKVEILIDENLPQIYADETKTKQILYNLLSNAIKFTGENGIIKIAAHKSDNNAVISISDNGIGIPEEKLEEIFLPFRQLQEYRNRTYSGIGLGLTLVKEMVELQGGTIKVDSKPGKGSTFTFTIPIVPANVIKTS